MTIQEEYKKKLLTPDQAAGLVKDNNWLDFCWANGFPHTMDCAIAKRKHELHNINVRGSVLTSVPEILKDDDACKTFTWNSLHMGSLERKLAKEGNAFYIPLRYSELPKYYREMPNEPNIAFFVAPPIDENGYFSFGTNPSHLTEVCNNADLVIVEVNTNMPYTTGNKDHNIHISDVNYIVESDNYPIPTIDAPTATEIDTMIAKLVLAEIPNGSCLQLGIGGMPNTLENLILQSDLKDLGVHSEMYVDAFIDLTESGQINGSQKSIDKGLQTFTFALGSQKMYDFMDHNPTMNACSVDYINDARVISQIDNFMSINSCINLDLFGQVNSETDGITQISGAGGQLDFVLGAYLSNGGKSFICCSSTFTDKEGNLHSRIMPTLTPGSIVTTGRTNTHYLATEYGLVNVKGLSTWERAEAIISIVHPHFREELIAHAESMRIWRKSNKK